MPTLNTVAEINQHWDSDKVKGELARSIGKGLEAAAIFLTARVKELLSVPAPRIRVQGKTGKAQGSYYYRAKTKATKGAPPRKLSARLRSAQTHEIQPVGNEVEARVGNNVVYGRRLEYEDHRYLTKALERFRNELGQIVARSA